MTAIPGGSRVSRVCQELLWVPSQSSSGLRNRTEQRALVNYASRRNLKSADVTASRVGGNMCYT